ncbi:MAG TPA: endonuclease/exonuclease/phosphatase family protein [Steroidobacteraceae bacterium]|nr:endonuclease/exonuclease/phosphatase family protein [Steroidobacteraceae bacterium]
MRGLAVLALLGLAAQPAAADRITLATWNLEWMMTPATFDALAARCLQPGLRAGGRDRAIPCDLVSRARWSEQDLARLRSFAAALPLDVIALQEVDGAQAAAAVFPDHAFCFTKRRHVQNVGFAIRRGIPHRCNRDYRALGLAGNDVRWGADVTIFPGTPQQVRLLGVHLKSACHRDPLTDPRPDCRVLQQQVPVLEAWIDARAREGTAFAVLGDFNRRFDRERATARDARNRIVALWPEIDDGEPAEADLHNAGADRGAVDCNNGEGARMPIDYLVLSRRLSQRMVPGSFRAWDYAGGGRWPDHCVISVELQLETGNGL